MATTQTASVLDRNRQEYSRHWGSRFRRTWTYTTQGKLKRFRGLLKPSGVLQRPNLSVFDQGFGLGLMLFCFDRSCSLAGIELSATAVQGAQGEAARRGYPATQFIEYHAGTPLPGEWKERFDVVISSHVLEHIEDAEDAIGNLASLCRSGGVAFLAIPINEAVGADLNHFRVFETHEFLAMVQKSGFEILEYRECDRLWDILSPLAYALQRRPTIVLRFFSLIVNACTSIIPLWGLEVLDRVLRHLGAKNRQLMILCRPSRLS